MSLPVAPKNGFLTYGMGGTGKSSLAAKLAKYFWQKKKMKTRVVNADGGGTQAAFSPLVEKGIASIWHIDQWDERSIFSTLDLATKGWWPSDVEVPNSPLEQPVTEWKECIFCHGASGAKGLTMVPKCESCGQVFPAGTLLKVRREATEKFSDVGVIIFEGLTAFGDLLMRRLKKVDPMGGNTIIDGDFKISSSGQQHYGSAQSYLAQYVANTKTLPVEAVMWTALENRGDDEGKPLFGPKGPGKALTTACIPWFTDVFHLDVLAKKVNGAVAKDPNGMEILERKLFLAPHFPPDMPMYKFAAKTSAPAEGGMPLVIDASMEVYFSELEKATKKAGEAL